MDTKLTLFLVITIGVLLIFSSEWLNKLKLTRRSNALQEIAAMLGLDFVRLAKIEDLFDDKDKFPLSSGDESRIRNLMTGVMENIEISIFDYWYKIVLGTTATILEQTMISHKLEVDTLSNFSLRPKNLRNRAKMIFSAKRTELKEFRDYPNFLKNYILFSENGKATKEILDNEILEFLDSHEGFCIDALSSKLYVFKMNERISPQIFMDSVHKRGRLLKLFVNSSSKCNR